MVGYVDNVVSGAGSGELNRRTGNITSLCLVERLSLQPNVAVVRYLQGRAGPRRASRPNLPTGGLPMLGTMQLVRDQIDAILAALIDTGGPFDEAATFVGVAQELVNNGIGTVIGDVTPPTGAAATRQAVTWGTPYILNDGSAVVDSNAFNFAPAGVETGTVVAVYLATLATSGALRAFMVEQPPVTISLHHTYSAVLRLVVDPRGRWSVSFSWNG